MKKLIILMVFASVASAQGVTGSAAAKRPLAEDTLLVKDSAGHVVGPYLQAIPFVVAGYTGDVVVLKQFSMTFAIDFSTSVLGGGENIGQLGELFYASTDCTGTPYFSTLISEPTPLPLSALSFAAVGGTTAYVISQTGSLMTMNSDLQLNPGGSNGPCFSFSYQPIDVYPVVATFDLSALNFVPPFSVR